MDASKPISLFCCDVDLQYEGHDVMPRSPDFHSCWWMFRCPKCQRRWIRTHDRSVGSGVDWGWDAQAMSTSMGDPRSESGIPDLMRRLPFGNCRTKEYAELTVEGEAI